MMNGNSSLLKKLLYGSFIIYVLAVIYGISFHEPWRDEAQSWLIVKNLDFIGVFKKLPSEGHPPVWYLVIFPFAKLGFPYATQNLLSAIIMIAAVYILQFKTKLHPLIKLLIPFTYFFLYEYSLIARNYCVSTLFTAILIWQYPSRFERPWLFALCVIALFNTHMIIFTLCGSVTALYLYDALREKKLNKNIIGAIFLMGAGGLYLIPYITMSRVQGVFEPFVADHSEHIQNAIAQGFLANVDSYDIAKIMMVLICLSFTINYRVLFIIIGGIAGVVYILGYKFAGETRHAGIIFLVLLFAFGIAMEYPHYKKGKITDWITQYNAWLFVILIGLQIPVAFKYYAEDREEVFSDSRNAARFLKEQKLDKEILTGHFAWAISALLPYMENGKTAYYVECDRNGSYYVFDSCFVKQNWNHPPQKYIEDIFIKFEGKLDKVVMIFNYKLPDYIEMQLDKIYETAEGTIRDDEMYYIYKFKTPLK